MSNDDNGEKCFGAKHFSSDEPNDTWSIEQLGERARQQHEVIVRGERDLAPAYWELGRALQIARRQLRRGQGDSFWLHTAFIAFALAERGRFSEVTQRRRRLLD